MEKPLSRRSDTRSFLMLRASWTATLLVMTATVFSFLSHPARPTIATTSSWSGADFTYCAAFLKSWWEGTIANPYSYTEQRAELLRLYGYQGVVIMPLSWFPGAALLLYPLLQLADAASEVVAWNLLTLTLFASAVIMWLWQSPPSLAAIGSRTLIGVMLISSVFAARSLELGQTSLLGAGGLAIVTMFTRPGTKSTSLRATLCAMCLSIKPTYLVLAFGIMALHRRWATLAVSVVGVGALAIWAAQLFSLQAWLDWYYQLRFHSNPIDSRYLSIGTEYGYRAAAVFRNVLTIAVSEIDAHRASGIISLACMALLLFRKLSEKRPPQTMCGVFWLLTIFLTTSPYVGIHDELLLFPILVAGWSEPNRSSWLLTGIVFAALAGLCFLPLPPLPRLAIKICLMTSIWLSHQTIEYRSGMSANK